MAYQLVENFAAGLDTRKSALTAPAGTLTKLINAVITPGGEIAKRRAFIKIADLPNSFGLATTGSSLYIFGKNVVPGPPVLTAEGDAMVAAGTNLIQLVVPQSTVSLYQTDYDTFDGKIYLACGGGAGALGANPHYYDDEGIPAGTMIATEGNGKGYYIRTYQSKIYSVIGRYLFFSAINQPLVWNNATDIAPVTVTYLSDGYPAYLKVAPADISKFVNGKFVVVSGATGAGAPANGFHRISGVNVANASFYLDEVNTTGLTAPITTGMKVDNAPTTGRGFINLSTQDAGSESMTGLEVYYDKMALFSTRATQIWTLDPDPNLNQYEQLLRDASTTAPRSALQYGSGDVLYLDSSGIRSLKAKDSSNSASVSDIGSPVDSYLQDLLKTKGAAYMNKAVALLEPSIGRFWMVFGDQILTLSYFPGPKITAWAVLTLPEIAPYTIEHACTCGGRIYIRDTGARLWVYGGIAGSSYNNCGVEVRLPYLDAKKPGHKKLFRAFDLTASGTWRVAVSYNFNDPEQEDIIGTFPPVQPATSTSSATWNSGASEMQGYDSHVSLRFYNDDALPATVSNCAIHYEMAEAED